MMGHINTGADTFQNDALQNQSQIDLNAITSIFNTSRWHEVDAVKLHPGKAKAETSGSNLHEELRYSTRKQQS